MDLQMTMITDDEQSLDDYAVLNWRCVLLHKQRTSARTRFLCIGQDVVFPDTPDDAARLSEPEDADAPCGNIRPHPAAGIPALADQLGLPPAVFKVEGPPLGRVLDEDGMPPVWLVELVTPDPPFEAALAVGGRFISILETRRVAAVQRELLRRAYERVLG
jgi:hypothetical protein